MIRLFVAAVPPPDVRDRLLDLMGGVAGARWQRDDQLHLTLRFIGEVDRNTARDIAAALAGLRHPPVEVTLAGFGAFASRGRPNALWVGVQPLDAVAALHRKVEQALVRAGIPPESRSFHPHITLARLGGSAGGLGHFMASAYVNNLSFLIDEILLFESVLSRDGSEYRALDGIRLG